MDCAGSCIRCGQIVGRAAGCSSDSPKYTLAEYNAEEAAVKEQNPQNKIKLLDDFVKQYPNSTLMPYIYRAYYLTDYA